LKFKLGNLLRQNGNEWFGTIKLKQQKSFGEGV